MSSEYVVSSSENTISAKIDRMLSKASDVAFENKGFMVLLVALMLGIFVRFYNLSYFHFMVADESVYTHAVFAITKGYVPYKELFVAHPPIHFLVQYLFLLVSSSLLMVRFLSVMLGLGSTILTLYAARALYSERVARLATIFFALAPYAIFFNKLAIVENTLLFFATLTFYLFFKYYRNGGRKWLMLSGFFVGVAIMSKYTMLFVVIVLLAFVAVKKEFKNLILFIACCCVIPLILLFMIFLFDAFNIFYIQTVGLQMIRFTLSLSARMWEISLYCVWISPLALLALPALPLGRKKEDLFLTFLCVVPLIIMFSGKTFFTHYPLMLTPIICILAARGLDLSFSHSKGSIKKKVPILFLVGFLIFHFCVASMAFSGLPSIEFDVRRKLEVANYVRSITNKSDKIWTTEADIGFFAQRMIVTPNSTFWKFQGFYEDVWGYFGTGYVGQHSGYPSGLITITDIQQALEKEKPKIVVFMEFKIADHLAWNGISNPNYKEIGLADYILAHYYLKAEIYDIRIYVRR